MDNTSGEGQATVKHEEQPGKINPDVAPERQCEVSESMLSQTCVFACLEVNYSIPVISMLRPE